MASPEHDVDYTRGRTLYDNFVRGDAVIGLIADVPATERAMLDALWSAAARGHSAAYRTIGECYLAALRPLGAFDGVDAADADDRPWSEDARGLHDELPALQATLRAFAEAARLGDRGAVLQFARLTRSSSAANQRLAIARLAALHDPTPNELYQRGLVHQWLGEPALALPLHVTAAERGDADAMFELYIFYAQGIAVEVDTSASRAWLDRAAAAEHPRALYNVGAAFASGSDGAPDMAKAASFYRRAADRGNARAAATLGAMILGHELDGTTEDAIAWLDRADEGGYPTWEMLEAMDLEDPREAS